MIYWGDDFPGFESVFGEFGAVLSLASLKKDYLEREPREMTLFDFANASSSNGARVSQSRKEELPRAV